MQNEDTNKSQNPTGEIPKAVTLSNNEIAYDIWIFGYDKSENPILKGLYRYGILQRLIAMGYMKRIRENNSYLFIQEQENIISVAEPLNMKDDAFGYVQKNSKPLEFRHINYCIIVPPEKFKEVFLRQSHLVFNEKFLEQLPTHIKPILKDEKKAAHFFFNNCIVKVTANRLETIEYSQITETCIWKTHIRKRTFHYTSEFNNCHYSKFIRNVTNDEEDRCIAFKTAIGHLLHNFCSPTKSQAVIGYDEEITDLKNPQGGTGKGLFGNAIKELRDVEIIDGKNIKKDSQFKFQKITDHTQMVFIDDINPEIGFEMFYSCLTDGWTIEPKHKPQFFIKPVDSPKMFLTCNAILKGGGTSNKRRQFPIEFSNHYSKKIKQGNEEPIKEEHGCVFFDEDDWTELEWNMFYSFMLDCVALYLQNGLKTYTHHNIDSNKLIQATSDDFSEWIEEQNFELDVDYNMHEMFEKFKQTYYGEMSDFKARGFTNWLKKFAASKGWKMKIKRSNSISSFRFEALRREEPIKDEYMF